MIRSCLDAFLKIFERNKEHSKEAKTTKKSVKSSGCGCFPDFFFNDENQKGEFSNGYAPESLPLNLEKIDSGLLIHAREVIPSKPFYDEHPGTFMHDAASQVEEHDWPNDTFLPRAILKDAKKTCKNRH